ncbi:MAG: 50S ribosomal protein L6 [Chthoniobacterales bacterium]
MSRIGKKNILIPDKVKVDFAKDGSVKVEGPKGRLEWVMPQQITATIKENEITFQRSGESRSEKALHGLSRALVSNMVDGVNTGFKEALEIHGVGFKAAVQGSNLNLNLGFSHPVLFPIPEGIKVTVTENTKIAIEGINKQVVGQVAANIRAYYPPEPYKGKGVRYVGEQIRRKEGKTVQ